MHGLERAALLLSCEHARNSVPARWRGCFRGRTALLRGHRGWDAGALHVARALARAWKVPLVEGEVSRFVVDLNRSPDSPDLFGPWTRGLPESERRAILHAHYLPYRKRFERLVAAARARGRAVVHLSVHSFTPRWKGRRRRVDVGILHDPARRFETALARDWREAFARARPDLRVRRNEPYRGTSDGFTTWLRRGYPDRIYAGLELELGQNLLDRRGRLPADIVRALRESFPARATEPDPERRVGRSGATLARP